MSVHPLVGKCYKDGSELLSLCCDNRFGERQGLGFYRFPAVPEARRKETSRLGSIETLENTVKPLIADHEKRTTSVQQTDRSLAPD